MGAAPPPGGNGCGNAGGAESASGANIQRIGTSQASVPIVVKIFSGSSATPFTGLVDEGGYFFVPFIPEGEPFTALAIDTGSGQTRTFEGVGPATGDSVFMFFDFFNDDGSGATTINIGDVVNGEISTAGEIDIYTFTASAGQSIFFDAQGTSASYLDVNWRIEDAGGKVVASRANFSDVGPLTLSSGGNYILTIFGQDDTTSTYQFQVWNVPPPDQFTINIEDIVSTTNPGNGSGNIETPGVRDIYTFTASAGQSIFFDAQGTSASYLDVNWRIEDAGGNLIASRANFSDDGPFTLSSGGNYILTVFGQDDTTSTYQFQVWNVPPPDQFTINIGDVVSTTNPGNGSGNIETPGVQDIYTFTASAGQSISFDAQGTSASYLDVNWRIEDADGNLVASRANFSDDGPFTLSSGGNYTLTIFGQDDTTSTYQFQIIEQ